MVLKNKYISECEYYVKGLEYTATFYSSLYLICILVPVLLDLLILTDVLISISFPIFSLLLSIIPFTQSKNIESIQSYRDLAAEFQNLAHDIETLEEGYQIKLKKLRLQLSRYNVNPIIKYFLEKKI